ncbi:MAG: DNA polymerase Y family protein, partial [Pseudomonadota bacterium]|nr:DNA polymerase Y family protein [Pseudomonadota bacterium]
IAHLSDELCPDLRQAGLGIRRVDLLFHRVDRTSQALTARTARPSRDPAHIGRLLADNLDEVDPGFGIEEAVIVATRVEPLSEQQMQARALGGDEEERELDALVDRLTARLGRDRVFRVVPVESDIPERSLARVPPLTPPHGLSWPKGLTRPSILIDPPEPVVALAVAPDHAPSVFEWRKVRHRVRRADGPERVHGEWWASPDEVSATRDYYQVENQDGRRFWLFRDGPAGQGGRWWLHGFFG